MSEGFFPFTIRCPKCGTVTQMYDGYETDDWVEVFIFSGYSKKSACINYTADYLCQSCSEKTDRDLLYQGQYIELESVEHLIEYLENQLESVVERSGIYDHGWEPDLDTVLYRYCLLYPMDPKLAKLKSLYYQAIHNPAYFTKFAPAYGTRIVSANMIPYKHLLKKIYLPDSVTSIEDYAFSNTQISDAFLPRHVTSVGKGAFQDCFNLCTVHSSDALTEIGDYAFAGSKIRKFFFPSGIKTIGEYAFKGTHLSEVYIPVGCREIGEGAFADCNDLKKITISGQFGDIKKYFEPTVDLYDFNDENTSGSRLYSFIGYYDYINSDLSGYHAEKKYDLMVYFTCSHSICSSFRKNSAQDAMSDSCLSICSELVNDSDAPIGAFRLTDESGITLTDQLMIVKVPDPEQWKINGNLEKIKEIYDMIIRYAVNNHFKTLAFPLWKQDWNFHYYFELLLYIKPLLKEYHNRFDRISWYSGIDDFFYDFYAFESLRAVLRKVFHVIAVERI